MRAIQVPLLPDPDQAAGQNVDGQPARNWKNDEHARER